MCLFIFKMIWCCSMAVGRLQQVLIVVVQERAVKEQTVQYLPRSFVYLLLKDSIKVMEQLVALTQCADAGACCPLTVYQVALIPVLMSLPVIFVLMMMVTPAIFTPVYYAIACHALNVEYVAIVVILFVPGVALDSRGNVVAHGIRGMIAEDAKVRVAYLMSLRVLIVRY